MADLKSLEQANAEKMENQFGIHKHLPVQNGIACPKCGEELFDSSPNTMLTSNPPQKNIHCNGCGYTGYRIA